MTLDDFLEFEKEHDLLKYKFSKSGYCMWPYIRHQIVSYLLYENNSSIKFEDTTLPEEKQKIKPNEEVITEL